MLRRQWHLTPWVINLGLRVPIEGLQDWNFCLNNAPLCGN